MDNAHTLPLPVLSTLTLRGYCSSPLTERSRLKCFSLTALRLKKPTAGRTVLNIESRGSDCQTPALSDGPGVLTGKEFHGKMVEGVDDTMVAMEEDREVDMHQKVMEYSGLEAGER